MDAARFLDVATRGVPPLRLMQGVAKPLGIERAQLAAEAVAAGIAPALAHDWACAAEIGVLLGHDDVTPDDDDEEVTDG